MTTTGRRSHKLTNGTAVGRERFTGGGVGVAHDQDVVKTIRSHAEGIREGAARAESDFGIITRCLVGRASVKVPLGETFDTLGLGRRQTAKCLSS